MTSITTNVKHRVRTTGSEHQDQNSISDPDQNLGFTCIFLLGLQEIMLNDHTCIITFAGTSNVMTTSVITMHFFFEINNL